MKREYVNAWTDSITGRRGGDIPDFEVWKSDESILVLFPRIDVVVLLLVLVFQESRKCHYIRYARTGNGKRVKKKRVKNFWQTRTSHTSKLTKRRNTRSLNQFLSLFFALPRTWRSRLYLCFRRNNDKKNSRRRTGKKGGNAGIYY